MRKRQVRSAAAGHLAGPPFGDVRVRQRFEDLLTEVISQEIVARWVEDLLLLVVVRLEAVFQGFPDGNDLGSRRT